MNETIENGDHVYFVLSIPQYDTTMEKYFKATSDMNQIKWDVDSGKKNGNFDNSEFVINYY